MKTFKRIISIILAIMLGIILGKILGYVPSPIGFILGICFGVIAVSLLNPATSCIHCDKGIPEVCGACYQILLAQNIKQQYEIHKLSEEKQELLKGNLDNHIPRID